MLYGGGRRLSDIWSLRGSGGSGDGSPPLGPRVKLRCGAEAVCTHCLQISTAETIKLKISHTIHLLILEQYVFGMEGLNDIWGFAFLAYDAATVSSQSCGVWRVFQSMAAPLIFICGGNSAGDLRTDCCINTSDIARRQHLRSAGCRQLLVPRHRRSMFGRRAFSVAGLELVTTLSSRSDTFFWQFSFLVLYTSH